MVTRGEEDATIVIDVGSSSAKAGFSGEDMPRASRECYVEYGAEKGAEGASTGAHPVRRGILRDIDEMEKLVDNLFNFELAAYAGAHTPVLMVEPPLNERAQRQEMAGMMFETFKFDTVRDMKEKLCYITTAHGAPPGEDEYELPDGSTVSLDSECRSQAAELIFKPEAGGEDFAAQATDGGLASMVMQSVSMCDKDINPDLLGSVVVAGGTTMMPGFVERLKEDLDKASPPEASTMASVIPHPTSHEPGYNAQRKHAPWIGGSMLASLSPFKQLQVTRQEYEDSGESIIHRIFL
eukprot:g10743.t1